MQEIYRAEYINKLLTFRDKQVIKIITGIRRCGKSTLMQMFQKHLKDNGVSDDSIISINFEDYDFYDLREPKALYAYVTQRLKTDGMNYIFFDEIQQVRNFQEVVDSLFIKTNVDVYLTGSNAHMLSGELATLLSGRYVEIKMLPLSFAEFRSASATPDNLPKVYADYLSISSFPYALTFADDRNALNDYLQGIFNTIVVKDIMSRHGIQDPSMLESVVRFAFDNVGNVLSTKRIADTMTANGRKIDTKSVEKYLHALTECFVLYKASRYNIRGKQHLKTMEKYYAVDLGLRQMLLGSRSFDVGRLLENVVFLELLRRGGTVSIGKVDNLEVDFVVQQTDGISYYQVAATVRDNSTLERELASLRLINDHYPKYLLTLDEDPDADYDGIIRRNALHWLAEGQ